MFGLANRETFTIEYLIANIGTGLLLLGNNEISLRTVATDKYQRTKVMKQLRHHKHDHL